MNYRLLNIIILVFLFLPETNAQDANLFNNPSKAYRPWIFWDWVNDMVTKKGIASDLKQFNDFGLSGTLIMLVGSETTDRQIWSNHNMPNPIVSQTPEFFDAWKFAAEKSAEYGLTIATQCGPGWCHSGGPWIKPDQAVQHLAYSELQVTGGNSITIDVDSVASGQAKAFRARPSADDSPQWVKVDLKRNYPIAEIRIHAFDNDGLKRFGFPGKFKLELSNSPEFYVNTKTIEITTEGDNNDERVASIKFDNPEYRYIRITTSKNDTTSVRGKTQYILFIDEVEVISGSENIASKAEITASSSIEDLNFGIKALIDNFSSTNLYSSNKNGRYALSRPGFNFFTKDVGIVAYPDKNVIDTTEIINLTDSVRQGMINIRLAPGSWIIRRYAMRNAQAFNRPPPIGGKGLESDKLDKDAVDSMFDGMIGRFLKNSPQLVGKTIKAFEADSWEVGNPEWSAKFKEEFIKRRGYNPTPWLVGYKTGMVVQNEDLTKRFLNDLYLTQTDLFAENFFSHLAKKADSLNMDFMTEPYVAPFDPIRMAGRVQVPMCEFWVSTEMMHTARWASSAANTYGRKEVAAEGFTGRWNDGNWKMDLFAIKRVGDLAFCNGVNKMILHGTALQPWGMDWKPGMNMFYWGTMFVPGQTWWKPAKKWVDYISRCQYMLQQGKNVADVAGIMPTLGWQSAMPKGLHKKYNYDLMSEETFFNDLDFSDGFFRLPSGAKYRVLMLPKTHGLLGLTIIEKLTRLVMKGGTVVCEDRPSKSTGLSGYPSIDTEIATAVRKLWGTADGVTTFENKLGKGRLIWMDKIWADEFDPERDYFLKTREKDFAYWSDPALTTRWSTQFENLLRSFISPDVEIGKVSGTAIAWGGMSETIVGKRKDEDAIAWTHRELDGRDIYFLSNQTDYEGDVDILFRVKDKIPQIWNPESGKLYTSTKWQKQGDRIKMTIPFNQFEGLFVLFSSKSDKTIQNKFREETIQDSMLVKNNWTVTFPKNLGAPASAQLNTGSWTESEQPGIKYFSGTATYRATIDIPSKARNRGVILDLGVVRNLLEVKINGRVVDTLWKPPFKVDITDFVRGGKNDVELKITNTWWNRMVGDEQLPEDLTWHPNMRYVGKDYRGYELKEFPDWIWNGKQRPSKDRVTFTPWKFVEKNSPLVQSGLIGPVQLKFYK